MFLSLLIGGAALLIGGKIADEALKNMSPEEIEDLANGIKGFMSDVTNTANELNELGEIYKAADECEKELDRISKM
jgi:archaellum component FlaC